LQIFLTEALTFTDYAPKIIKAIFRLSPSALSI
jgi:hypothetical protein